MEISNVLLDYVSDGDLHIVMDGIEHSTNVREIVTVGYMLEQGKTPTAATVSAMVNQAV